MKSKIKFDLAVPRNKRCAMKALSFVVAYFSKGERACSQKVLNKNVGYGNTPFGKYLRETLLTPIRENWSIEHGTCKTYTLNHRGVDHIRERLQIEKEDLQSVAINVVAEDYHIELTTGNFNYEEKSNRKWHKLQFFPANVKKQILKRHGYMYNYDISCCAPVLLLYKALNMGMGVCNTPLTLLRYIESKTKRRIELAERIGITESQAKEIINALFCGAKLGVNKNYALYQLIDYNEEKMKLLIDDHFIKDLRSDINLIWSYLSRIIPRKHVRNKSGKLVLERISSSMRWGLYFRLEREMLKVIETHLKTLGIRYFLEHDGWATDVPIDVELLKSEIVSAMQTHVSIEMEDLGRSLNLNTSFDDQYVSDEIDAMYGYFVGSEYRRIIKKNIMVSSLTT